MKTCPFKTITITVKVVIRDDTDVSECIDESCEEDARHAEQMGWMDDQNSMRFGY